MKYDKELKNKAKKYFFSLNPDWSVEKRIAYTISYLQRIHGVKVSKRTLYTWKKKWIDEITQIEEKARELAIKKTSNDLASSYESYFKTAENLLRDMLRDYKNEGVVPQVRDILKLLELIGKMKGYIVERKAVVSQDLTPKEPLEFTINIVETAEEREFLEWREKHSQNKGEATEKAIVYQ